MSKKAVVVLADGFEEVEAITPVDMLKRAEIDVVVCGLNAELVRGAHDVYVKADVVLKELDLVPDAIIFPGGMPGAENLARSLEVKTLISRIDSHGGLIAAICASPALVLAPTGILDGKKATCYPGLQQNFSTKVKYVKDAVVQDGNVITSKGPATAMKFSLKIIEALSGKAKADMVGEHALVDL
jgi:4-methyl-5(b-hydroxyethyl)-thiazole monophosphate biosynthesis